MTLQTLAKLIREMRAAQNEYFRTRTATSLTKAKTLEHKVDEILKTIPEPIEPQQKLF